MKKKVLSLLKRLGANAWNESVIILTMLFSLVFYRSLSSAESNETAYEAASQRAQDFIRDLGYALPFIPNADSFPILTEIGSFICEQSFSSVYSSLINPFAVYPPVSNAIPLAAQYALAYETILHIQKLHSSSVLSFPSQYQALNSDKYSGLNLNDIMHFVRSIELICMDSDNPVLKTGHIQSLLTYRKKNIGVSNDMILHMYVLIYVHGVRSWNKACEDKIIKTYDPLIAKPLFEKVLDVSDSSDPIMIIKALLYPPTRNLSGLETSYLYQLIKKDAVPESTLILDPSPDLVQKIVSFKLDCCFMFSNPYLKDIYTQLYPDYKHRIYALNVAWASMPKYDFIVWFGTGDEWKYVKETKEENVQITDTLSSEDDKAEATKKRDGKLRENKYYTYRKLQPLFRCRNASCLMIMTDVQFNNHKKLLADNFSQDGLFLNSILLLPTGRLTTIRKSNSLILKLTHETDTEYVEILSMVPTEYKLYFPKQIKARILHKHLFVKYSDLMTSEANIRTFYHQQIHDNARARSFVNHQSAQQYMYSDEITVYYRLYENRKGRPYTAICYYKSANGNRSKDIEKSSDTIDGIYDTIENLVNHELRAQIKSDIRYRLHEGDLKGVIPCMKTLWFYSHESIKINETDYSSELCEEIFSKKHPDISSLHPDSHTEHDEYERIVNLEYPECNSEMKNRILLQINTILEASKDVGIAVYISPIHELLRISNLEKNERAEMRTILKRNHYSDDEEKRIAEYVFAKPIKNYQIVNNMTESIFDICIHYYPVDRYELCALTWSDVQFLDITHIYELVISKKVDTKNRVILYSNILKPLKDRLVPLAPLLTSVIEKYKELLIAINPSACEPERPFLQITSDDHPRTLTGLTANQANKFLKALDEYSGRLDVHNFFDLPESDEQDDLDQRKGPPMISSWFHHCTILGMHDGQTSYTIGINPDSTDDKHYSGYMSPFLQEKIALIINRWINHMLLSITPTLIQGSFRRKAIIGPLKIAPHTHLQIFGGTYGLKLSVSVMQKDNEKGAK